MEWSNAQLLARRRAGLLWQSGSIHSRHHTAPLVPPDASMSEHVEITREFVHPFGVPADMPVDLRFAARRTLQTATVGVWRTTQWAGIQQLAVECAPLDKQLRDRMGPEVHKVAGTTHLGLLCALIHLIRWPD